jgi:hypothetical protein
MTAYACNGKNDKVAVVYLARAAEGAAAFRRFAESYRNHPAAMPHELVVVYKGFDQVSQLREARTVFAGIPHRGIEVDDSGFDIGSYLTVARKLDHHLVCFLNTHTELQAAGWLALLHRHASKPNVGIAGAMGSFESLSESFRLITNIIWLCNHGSIDEPKRLIEYYDFVIGLHCQDWKAGYNARRTDSTIARIRALKSRVGAQWNRSRFQRYWESQTGSAGALYKHSQFPAFPNPHIRSNGFMIARHRLLEANFGAIESKMDAFEFESGTDSLTQRLRRQGLDSLVVGRDGSGYAINNWFRSGTFRLGEQSNLLLTDNQSRNFVKLGAPERATFTRISWGDYFKPAPPGFLDFDLKFAVNPQIVDPASPKRRKLKSLVLEQQARIDALEESCRIATAESLRYQLLADSRERQFREVLDSFCWRCTKPIRIVGTCCRRLKRSIVRLNGTKLQQI